MPRPACRVKKMMMVATPFRLLCLVLAASALCLAAEKEADTPFCRIFDTGASADEAPSIEVVGKKAGWKLIPENDVAHPFVGDAVLANDKLTVVVQRKTGSVGVYATTASGPTHRALLGHTGAYSSTFDRPESLKIIENTPGGATLEAAYGQGKATLRLRLTTGEGILEIRPGEGARSVDVLTKSFCVLVPDFFADDMIFVPEKFNGTLLPAENFFLNLIEGGDAMMMAVWQSSQQDVTLNVASVGADTKLCWTRITCAKDKSLWLAFLEHPKLWDDAAAAKAGWKPPFPAHLRCTVGSMAPFATSWDWEKGPGGRYLGGRVDGPWVAYPIDRTKATPLTAYTPMDVLRNTLGVGPCQYILQSEGLASETNPTPDSVMDWVEKQFKQGKEKQATDEIKARLNAMVEHMEKVRKRIWQYADWATATVGSAPWPRLVVGGASDFVAELHWMRELPDRVVKEAGWRERPGQLASQVAALIGKEDALAECEKLGAELREIGAKLDGTLSKCRMRTRWLRQRCRMAAAQEPQSAELAKMIQERAERMLQSK